MPSEKKLDKSSLPNGLLNILYQTLTLLLTIILSENISNGHGLIKPLGVLNVKLEDINLLLNFQLKPLEKLQILLYYLTIMILK
jgi:hypothetical protein